MPSVGNGLADTFQIKESSPPLRLALFTGAYNHIADGVSLTLNRLVAHLERRGISVRVIAPTVDDPPLDHNGTLVPTRSIPALGRPEYRISLGLPRSAKKRLKAFRPTLIHIATPDLLGRKALSLAQKWNVPVVASYHTHFSSYLKYYKLQLLEGVVWSYLRAFYRKCQHIYVPTPSMASVLRAHDISDGLRLWERGVNTAKFSPKHRNLEWRRSLGIDDDDVLITFVSRLVFEKGVDVFADVIERLQARGISHRTMIVGRGPARKELERRIPGTIFTGHLEGNALSRAYASSDLFLFPSDTETFGNVTLEAMSSGLPTVCADAPGSNTLVEHGKTGQLVPAGKVREFTDAIAYLIKNDTARKEMGRAARQQASRYEWQSVLDRLVGYYREILTGEVIRDLPTLPFHAGDGAATPHLPELAAS